MERVTAQGVEVPTLGLGTWRLTGEECRRSVETALELGYRHLDTAQAYGNEREVGTAIRASEVPREEVFLVTKLHARNRSYDAVLRSVDESLSRLDTSYVDLLLIHSPNAPVVGPPHSETLAAMHELRERGKVRHVGVSNFSLDQLDDARQYGPVLTNQVQFNPYWDQQTLLDYCDIHDVLLTAYSPLAHGGVLDDPVLREVGERHGKSPAQVAIRWCLQHGTAVIPKATSRAHLAANLDVFDFELSDGELARIRRPNRLKALWPMVRGVLD
jgi:2,5-diketo-D-gluconate reductase B